MNEIPKNAPTGIPSQPQQSPKIDAVAHEAVSEQVSETTQDQVPFKGINEIPDNPADRSRVKADNLESDLRVFSNNPVLVQKALAVSDAAEKRYSNSGVADPAFKGLAVGKAFVDEFQK